MSEHAIVRQSQEVSLSQYNHREYNVLYPVPKIMRISPFHQVQVSEVQLSVNDGDGDTYSGSFTRLKVGEREVQGRAISKNGLHKLFRAAGGEWVTKGCYFVDDGRTSKKIKYRAEGRIPKQDGSWLSLVCHREVDVSDDHIKKNVAPRMQAAYIEHAASMCESKAQNRVIRGLLQIKQVYSIDELRRPFVVPQVVYSPDFNDPEIRRLHALAAMGAQGDLMGSRRELPGEVIDAEARVSSMREVEEAPTTEVVSFDDDAFDDDDMFGEDPRYGGTTFEGWLKSLSDVQTMEELNAIGRSLTRFRDQIPADRWQQLMDLGQQRRRALQGAA